MAKLKENSTILKSTGEEIITTREEVDKKLLLKADKDYVDTQLAAKVDKVAGKGLSTNDYTDEEKQKLAGIEEGANKYTHPSTHSANMIVETSSKRFVSDTEKAKWNDAVEHIEDNIRHITEAERDKWNTVENKVDKVAGKGLSTNDYTDEEKQKNQDNADNISNLQQELETHKAEIATQEQLGHVKAGQNITIDEDGTINAIGGNVNSVNGKTGDVILSASDVGAVPTSRKVNNKELTSDITIDVSDIPKLKSLSLALGAGASARELAVALGMDASAESVSVALGMYASAAGNSSVALGGATSATGDGSVAIAPNASAAGEGSVALGLSAKAERPYAVALGREAWAIGDGSIVLGREATAEGDRSVALGPNTFAERPYTVALGRGASANNDNEGILGGTGSSATSKWKVPGSFSVSGTKNFEIPHPKPEKSATHVIRHSTVESPTPGDTLYRWKIQATKDNDIVTIDLPDYFIWLNKDVQIFVTPQGHFGNGYGVLNRETEQLEIHCQYEGEYNVLVIGTRNDNHQSVQDWYIKGVEREIGESWTGETYAFSVDEIIEVEEIKEVSV